MGSKNPAETKIAIPYARALYDFSIEQNLMHQITSDFQSLSVLLNKTVDLTDYLQNPIIRQVAKQELLEKTLKSINGETFKFLSILVKRKRINLIEPIIQNYLNLVYELASIKMIEVSSAFAFTNLQKNTLIKKKKKKKVCCVDATA